MKEVSEKRGMRGFLPERFYSVCLTVCCSDSELCKTCRRASLRFLLLAAGWNPAHCDRAVADEVFPDSLLPSLGRNLLFIETERTMIVREDRMALPMPDLLLGRCSVEPDLGLAAGEALEDLEAGGDEVFVRHRDDPTGSVDSGKFGLELCLVRGEGDYELWGSGHRTAPLEKGIQLLPESAGGMSLGLFLPHYDNMASDRLIIRIDPVNDLGKWSIEDPRAGLGC
jgi:hypothetical protein